MLGRNFGKRNENTTNFVLIVESLVCVTRMERQIMVTKGPQLVRLKFFYLESSLTDTRRDLELTSISCFFCELVCLRET